MEKYQPIEIPRDKTFGSNYYISYSKKNKRNVILYSQLEYHNHLTLEMNPHVIKYCEQPLQIYIEIAGTYKTSIFDMWVLYDDGTEEFQEVKYIKDIEGNGSQSERTRQQMFKQEEWCKLHGYQYIVRTDRVLHLSQYYISNLRYLHGLLLRNNDYILNDYITQITECINNSKVSILKLTENLQLTNDKLFPAIAYGIYKGIIKANLEKAIISYDSYIWLNKDYVRNGDYYE
jgi:hypothetical protein